MLPSYRCNGISGSMVFSSTIASSLFSCLLYSSTARAAAITNPNLSLLLQASNTSLAKFTSLGNDLHPHFHIAIGYGNDGLPATAMLMDAVDSLAKLAPLDYLGRQPNFHGHMEAYPQVVIDVDPVYPATDVENRVAVLCIYWGMETVVSNRNYKNAEIDCFWDNVVVAQVRFEQPGYYSSATVETNSPISSLGVTAEPTVSNGTTPGLTAGNSTLNSPTALNTSLDARVNSIFYFRSDSQTLSLTDVFIITMATLKNVASFPSTDAVTSFTSGAGSAYDLYFAFASGETIRTRPPFYEYRWIIETVRQIPAWMLSQRRFAEISIGILVDDVHLGSAVLEKGEQPHDPPGVAVS